MDIIHSSPESLKTSLRGGKIAVAVYGLGHVGLAIAAVWLDAGAMVIGVDINEKVVKSINSGVSPMRDEPGLPEIIGKYVSEGMFRAVTDGTEASRESDVKIVAVPTTLTAAKKCDLTAVREALKAIAGGLKKGDLVIIESSVPPTTTTTVAKQILENVSSLKVEEGFGLAFSPERVYEGRVLEDIKMRYPKVVGGVGERSTEAAAALYEVIAQKGTIKMSSSAEAETSKLFEGIYRDANIALANELARFCGAMGMNFKEVREAANSQPFCHLHLPGFVGGWCIPFYPHFVLQIANQRKLRLPLTSLARRINENKPQLLVKVAELAMKEVGWRGLSGSKAAVLGLAFRADVPDVRNSPSFEVIDLLVRKGVKEITAYDPHVTQNTKLKRKSVHLATNAKDAVKDANMILVMTDHSAFKNNLTPRGLLEAAAARAVLIDGRNVLHYGSDSIETRNFRFKRVEGFNVFVKSTDGLSRTVER